MSIRLTESGIVLFAQLALLDCIFKFLTHPFVEVSLVKCRRHIPTAAGVFGFCIQRLAEGIQKIGLSLRLMNIVFKRHLFIVLLPQALFIPGHELCPHDFVLWSFT